MVVVAIVLGAPPLFFLGLYALLFTFGTIPPPAKEDVEAVLGCNPWVRNCSAARSIGHRGLVVEAPENSLSAVRLARASNIHIVEFDIILSKDKVAVIFHDDTLERVTEKCGFVRDLLWEDIKNISISSRHKLGYLYQHEKIPTLKQMVDECIKDNLSMIMDVKDSSIEMLAAVIGIFRDYRILEKKAIVSSFDAIFLYKVRKENPNIVTSLAYQPYVHTSEEFTGVLGPLPKNMTIMAHIAAKCGDFFDDLMFSYFHKILGISVLMIHKDLITTNLIRQFHEKHIRVIGWTVNNPVEKQFFKKILNVSYVTDTVRGE